MGDLKTAWKELEKAFMMGVSEVTILFVKAGPINDIAIPGIIHRTYPNETAIEYKRPPKIILPNFSFNNKNGTFGVINSLFSKYKAGTAIYKTESKAIKALNTKENGNLIIEAMIISPVSLYANSAKVAIPIPVSINSITL